MPRLPLVILALSGSLLLSACGTVCYYTQAVGGEVAVLRAREPIAQVLRDPATDPQLRQRLTLVRDARNWAVKALDLPDNGSYRSYADVGRPYVVWNVFATPEFSTEPVEHCFPIAGCVGYQGWYSKQAAERSAQQLAARGDDTHVSGVPAYSTLGWFDDPVLNTMMHWDDATLLSTLFHELAHQKLYIKHDTRFNESFAEFVGMQGLRDYEKAHGLPQSQVLAERQVRSRQFTKLVLAARDRLVALYREPLTADVMRERKAAVFAQLRTDYQALRDGPWHGYAGYDHFFDQPMNNARLLPFGLYDDDLPAFAALFTQNGGDWPRFYAAARRLGKRPAAQRRAEIERLRQAGAADAS
ncbi:aminopeptidase [Solimonas marina]|uniref:Aminopeptidase n=1 Tax=Solimonas marina TaxID=2714601 RepID=A0A969WA41_9GAMM|nr:aminopeptidase [Solimonas marina]NKF22354.1 aminopeptidase [Solimonas marina]